MDTHARPFRSRASRRGAALTFAPLAFGAALLLAGCAQDRPLSGVAGSAAVAHPAEAAPEAVRGGPGPGTAAPGGHVAQLALASPSIVYTAALTVAATDVAAAARRAVSIVTKQGGYVSSEQATAHPARRARPTVSLQLKIPVAAYPGTLAALSAVLGTQISLSQHATDVTEQVADVTSLVTSAQDAITQLQALLKRAGSVSDLLSVQEQIDVQESSLESLQAQQRALARQTSYATVSVTLLGPPPRRRVTENSRAGGFVAGFAAGWRGLRLAGSAILTGAGAAAPFAIVAAVAAGIGYAGRRQLRRALRAVRRGSPPAAAG